MRGIASPSLRRREARRICSRATCRRSNPLLHNWSMGIEAPDASVGLLREIARGDRDAFARFYDLHATLVHTFALRILRERGEAEEVGQDVFLQVWRQAETYSAGRGTPEAWLITMARSRGIDKLRSRRRRDEMVRPADDPDRMPEPVRQERGRG